MSTTHLPRPDDPQFNFTGPSGDTYYWIERQPDGYTAVRNHRGGTLIALFLTELWDRGPDQDTVDEAVRLDPANDAVNLVPIFGEPNSRHWDVDDPRW